MTVIWLLLLINLTLLLLFSEYTIYRNGRRVSHWELYHLSISLKATSHLHLGHKASVTLGWTTIIEKVEPGTLGHEGRTWDPSMLRIGHSASSNLTQLWPSFFLYLFSTHVFSLHCISLHLFACCFVSIEGFYPLTYVLFCVPN